MVSEKTQIRVIKKLADKGGEFIVKNMMDASSNHTMGLSHLLAIAPMLMKKEDGTAVDAIDDLIEYIKDIGETPEKVKTDVPVELLENFKKFLQDAQ